MNVLEVRNRVFAPQSVYLTPDPKVLVSKERAMAFVIGVMAIFLAFGVAWLDEKYGPACARTSISHYFYEPLAGTFFVLVLSFVGAFMIAFRGQTPIEGILATFGGIGGLVLAFFPTENVGCYSEAVFDLRPVVMVEFPLTYEAVGDVYKISDENRIPDGFDIKPVSDTILASEARIGDEHTQFWHMLGAVAMFGVLLVFCLIFTRVDPEIDYEPDDGSGKRRLKWQKRARNYVYFTSAGVMAVGVLMILGADGAELLKTGDGPAFDGLRNNILGAFAGQVSSWMAAFLAWLPWGNDDYAAVIRPVYHGEMLALVAFGVSWLLKGRFGKSLYDFARSSAESRASLFRSS